MGGRAKDSSSDDGSLSTDDESRDSPRESRSRERRSSPPADNSSSGLSRFYRQRFGSQSPEDYMNLRVSGIKNTLTKEEVRTILEEELRKMAPFEIKIVRSNEDDTRFAYINFKDRDRAKTARRSLVSKLRKWFGRDTVIDPTGVLRDQEGKFIPDRFNRAQMAVDSTGPRRGAFPVHQPPQHATSVYHHNNNNNSGGHRHFNNLTREEHAASRTLFVGNLPGDIRQSELEKTFEKYGDIEDVDVKLVNDGMAAYAFVVFKSLESASQALKSQHNQNIRPGGQKCQIGYGRSQVSPRLWIGGLGDWTTKDMLLKEFDRYGVVENMEYTPGANHAYIRFADNSSASDACAIMKNFRIHKNYKILVDFAKDKKQDRKRPHSPDSNDDSSRRKRGPQTPSPNSSKSPAPTISTYEQLTDQVACTWKGFLVLKKIEYPLRLHRVAGREHLLQELLREEDGSAIKLKLDQRIAREPIFYDKLLDINSCDLAFMVGAEGSHSFTPMIEYLNEKKAIGMASLSNALVYVLPYCALTEKIAKKFTPQIGLFEPNSNFLLVILKSITV